MKFLQTVELFCIGATAVWLVVAAARMGVRDDQQGPTLAALVQAQETDQVKTQEAQRFSRSGHDLTKLSDERIAELARGLTDEERHILLDKGTEQAFCGGLLDNKEQGTYVCRLCSLPLFTSEAKFQSGTGWPSFFQPTDREHIHYERDTSHGMVRTEIQCERCRAHLGHVFDDGPKPTGLRYCLNSASLMFYANGAELPAESRPIDTQTAYFAGGCFWGVEDRFQQIPGVVNAVSGYMGGTTTNPTYKEVCSGTTGHAEAVCVTFDPKRVTYDELLDWFYKFHNPTQVNRQGPDIGTQYRSAIFAASDEQLAQARAFTERLQQSEKFSGKRIATQIEPAAEFYAAEDYHQDYHEKHGGSCPLPE